MMKLALRQLEVRVLKVPITNGCILKQEKLNVHNRFCTPQSPIYASALSILQQCCGAIQVAFPVAVMLNNKSPNKRLLISVASGLLAMLGAGLMAINLACVTFHSVRLVIASALACCCQIAFSVWSSWLLWTADPPGSID